MLTVWHADVGTFDPLSGQGDTFPDYTYGTHATDVEVDTDTGEVRVLRYVAVHDVGTGDQPDAGRRPDTGRRDARYRLRAL